MAGAQRRLRIQGAGLAGDAMKVITLRQPWASLVAIGAKRIETRSWSTPHRGPLAIHAAKGLGQTAGDYVKLCSSEPFWSALKFREPLPRGAIVATCELLDVLPIREITGHSRERFVQRGRDGYVWVWTPTEIAGQPGHIGESGWSSQSEHGWAAEHEAAFGDYSDGRFAWLLSDVRPFNRPIPAKGRLGLWEWDPAEVLV